MVNKVIRCLKKVIRLNLKIHKIQVACSSDCKLLCVDDKFSKPFRSYLGENAVYNFNDNTIEVSIYCSDVMKKHFNKELVMRIWMLF